MEQRPHTSHLRTGRYSQSGGVYLVTAVTANRKPVFADFDAARKLIGVLHHRDYADRAATMAFVVMPDHLHWLFQLGNTEALSPCVQRVKSMSSKLIGPHLWQKGFHDRAIRREDDLPAIARYIVANPVRAGVVNRVGLYPHWDAIWI
ncbi:MAG: transposase [Comamonadaceae bacterium PBBC1]|nr:MAG: transposase [Comamonadaceae bacterium PBBC1]